jgi:pimeloyl-ACP methyl ester carboxylesterase
VSTRIDEPARHRLAGPDGRFVRLDGIDVHHRVVGEPSPERPSVLLLHHFFGNVVTWRHVLAGLAPDHHVVAYDRPGFGLTERPPRHAWNGRHPYTRETAASLGLALLDHVGADDVVLVGSSAGGTAALEILRRAPQRVRGLVLMAPAITGDVGPPSPLRPLLRPAAALATRWIHRMAADLTPERVGRSWHDPSKATEEDADAYRIALEVPGWDEAFWHVVTAEPSPDLRHVLPTIDVPTLLVHGASDRVIRPSWSRRTAAAIPGARFVELDAVGHTPQEEAPERLLPLLRAFLDEVADGRGGAAG